MQYWLVKTEPGTFSWQDLLKDKKTNWDGVRNYQARNNLASMKNGDQVLVYHSFDKEVMGLAEVSKEAFPDPTADEGKWVAVEIIPLKSFKNTVTLEQIKNEEKLSEIKLIRHTRLSVMALQKHEFDILLKMGGLS
jgi:predicted RNA-binding protein with PUA-like domain